MSDIETPGVAAEIIGRPARKRRAAIRGIVAVLLVAVAIVVAAGCGGSSNDAADTTTSATDTTSTDTTSSADTTSPDTTATDTTSTDTTSSTDTSSTDLSAAGLSEGCQKVASLSVQLSKSLGATGAGGGQTDLESTAKAYEAFADKVPEEIRGAFKTLASAYAKYAAALKGVDVSSGKTPDAATIAKILKASQSLNSGSIATASTEISAWATKNCGTKP